MKIIYLVALSFYVPLFHQFFYLQMNYKFILYDLMENFDFYLNSITKPIIYLIHFINSLLYFLSLYPVIIFHVLFIYLTFLFNFYTIDTIQFTSDVYSSYLLITAYLSSKSNEVSLIIVGLVSSFKSFNYYKIL